LPCLVLASELKIVTEMALCIGESDYVPIMDMSAFCP